MIEALHSYEEGVWLEQIASKFETVVEIGAWKGGSTACFLNSGCKKVYAVDHFMGSLDEIETSHADAKDGKVYQEFMENVGWHPKLQVIRMESVEASKGFKDSEIDMVFIDGGHSYESAHADIVAWRPKCKKFLCGHDRDASGVSRSIKELLSDLVVMNGPGSLWFCRPSETH